MEVLRSILFILIVLAVLALGGLVVAGGGDGQHEGDRMIKINRRSSEIFEWLVGAEERKEWVAGLSRSGAPRSAPSVGSSFKEVFTVDGREVEQVIEVTEFEEDKRFGYRTTLEGVSLEIVYELRAHNTGRRSLLTATYKASWEGRWEKLIEPILSSRLRSRIEDELIRLKKVVEESAP